VKTIALFNNKGGVGKTTLCFHLAHMISRMDRRVVAVDLDPQANLTAYFLGIEEIEALWEGSAPATVWHCLSPALEGSELLDPELYEV